MKNRRKSSAICAAMCALAALLDCPAQAQGEATAAISPPFVPPPAAAPPSVPVYPDAHNRYWVLLEDMHYRIGDTNDHIVVPAGFVTDYASIPRGLWSFGLAPHGPYSRAALIHDYLYWSQGCTKDQADNLLLIAMKESHVDDFDEMVVFKGVQLGGQPSWDSNARERKSGMPRIVPKKMRYIPPNVTWTDYRVELAKAGVRDPSFPKAPSYCAHGNSRGVPGAARSKLYAQSRIVPAGNPER